MTAATGTTTCVKTFAADLKLPGSVGASTPQKSMPVSVMETVKTNLITCRTRGIKKDGFASVTAFSTKKRAQAAPIQRLDCTVKYKNAVPPPMNPPPIREVRVMPVTIQTAVTSSKSMDTSFDASILVFISSLSLYPPIVTKKRAEGKELFPAIGDRNDFYFGGAARLLETEGARRQTFPILKNNASAYPPDSFVSCLSSPARHSACAVNA